MTCTKNLYNVSRPVPKIEKIFFTIFLIILIPVYWSNYGIENFLWISDIALFLTYAALMFENRLLISIPTLGVLPVESFWIFEFLMQLITGRNFTNLAGYMFEDKYSLTLKLLSLFHIIMPIIWIKYLVKWGYDKRAIIYMTLITWSLAIFTYVFTDPKLNINWVFSPKIHNWQFISTQMWLVLLMLGIPLLIFIPLHFFLKKFFAKA